MALRLTDKSGENGKKSRKLKLINEFTTQFFLQNEKLFETFFGKRTKGKKLPKKESKRCRKNELKLAEKEDNWPC